MGERLTPPSGSAEEVLKVRRIHAGRMREEQPAVGQPEQDTIPGPGSADSE